MARRSATFGLWLLAATAAVVFSCSTASSSKKSAKAKPTPTVSSSNSAGCNGQIQAAASSTGGAVDTASGGLGLTVATYAEIKPIFDQNCSKAGCHAAGSTFGDFTTEAGIQSYGAKISDRITSTSRPMPPSGKLSDSLIQSIQAYLSGGSATPTTSSSPSPSTSPVASSSVASSSSSDCYTPSPTPSPSEELPPAEADFVESILHPAKMEECRQQGLMYNRNTQACDTAKLSTGACDRATILAAYKNNADIVKYLNDKDAKQYTYEQCGKEGNTFVVFFFCVAHKSENGEPRYPCMTVDEFRQNSDGTDLTFPTGCIGKARDTTTNIACSKTP